MLLFVMRTLLIFSFNSDLEGIEEFQIILIQLTEKFGLPYTNLSAAPCLAVPYTPLYHIFVSATASALNIDVFADIAEVYWIGRGLNLGFNMLTLLVFFKICQELEFSQLRSVMAAGTLFVFLTFHHFAVRPDSLRMLFVALTFLMVTKAINSQKIKPLLFFGGAIFMLLAFASKQDSAQVGIGVGIYFLLFRKDQFLPFFLYFCLPILLGLSAIGLILFNGLDLESLHHGLNTGIDLKYFLIFIGIGFLAPFSIWIYRGFRTISLDWKQQESGPLRMFHVVAIVTFLLSCLFSLRMGSMAVYFADFSFVLILILASDQVLWEKRFWSFALIGFVILKLVSVGNLLKNNLSPSFKQKYADSKALSVKINERLDVNEYAFSYAPQINIFITEKLSSPNLGYAYFDYLFHVNGFDVAIPEYDVASSCIEPKIILSPLDDDGGSAFLDAYHPNHFVTDTILGQIVRERKF